MVRFTVALVVACAGAAASARVEPVPPEPQPDAQKKIAPPPDTARGERFDGRAPQPSGARDLLAVPRILLAPIRLVLAGLSYPVRWIAEWSERHHAPQYLMAVITSRDGLIGVRPALSYTSSFVPLIGITFYDRRFIGPGTAFSFTLVGIDEHNLYTAVHMRPTTDMRARELDIDAFYNRRNDRLFNGIGLQIARGLPMTRYAVDEFELGARVRLLPAQAVRLAFGGELGVRRFSDGMQFGDDKPITEVYCLRDAHGACFPHTVDEALVPRFNEGTQFVRGTADLVVDSRDSAFRPSSGAAAHLRVQYSHGLGGGDDSSYFRLHGGLEAALDLWQRSRILIFRLTGDVVAPTDSQPVPFSELVTLGGPDDLRGARYARYRDFSSLLLTVEYRWPVWMWMDAALFLDCGEIAGRWFTAFDVRNLTPAIGGGVRVRTLSQFFLRAQVAYGFGEGWQFFFGAQVEP